MATRKSLWIWAPAVLAIAALCAFAWLVRNPRQPAEFVADFPSDSSGGEPDLYDQQGKQTLHLTPLAPLPSSRFANAAPDVSYVGANACIDCHQAEYESYLQTAHSRSFSGVDVDAEPPSAELQHARSSRSYRIYRRDGQLRHRELLHTSSDAALELGDHPLRYVVGSGIHARTYLIESDGFLFESPVTWYAAKNQWALSPGFEEFNPGFARPVGYDCLACHAGRVEAIGGNRNRTRIHAHAIDCERCHGPGSLHVQQRTSKSELPDEAEVDLTIVNPKHLSREQNESVCSQCHLHSEAAATVRGRNMRDYRPGHSLRQFRVTYQRQAADKPMLVTGHGEQMRQSACYRQSESLTCTSCHHPHDLPAEENRISYFRQKCLSCHETHACAKPLAARLRASPQDDCAGCHMPSTSTEVPHVAATHHRIGIHQKDASRPVLTGVELAPLDDVSHLPEVEQQRCLGLAFVRLSVQEADADLREAHRRRARKLLLDVRKQGVRDPLVDANLAKVLQQEQPRRAIDLANDALRYEELSSDARIDALVALHNAQLTLQQFAQAADSLSKLVAERRQSGDWFVLGICKYHQGDIDGALNAVREAAEIRPDRPEHHALLGELYQRRGDAALAAEHLQQAQQLGAARRQ